MSTALQAAREALTAALSALALPGVTVLGYEPPAVARGTTVTVSSAGIDPTEWALTVRVYVSGMQPADAQDLLDQVAVAVDAGLTVPRSHWEFAFDSPSTAFVATTVVAYPREDF